VRVRPRTRAALVPKSAAVLAVPGMSILPPMAADYA